MNEEMIFLIFKFYYKEDGGGIIFCKKKRFMKKKQIEEEIIYIDKSVKIEELLLIIFNENEVNNDFI